MQICHGSWCDPHETRSDTPPGTQRFGLTWATAASRTRPRRGIPVPACGRKLVLRHSCAAFLQQGSGESTLASTQHTRQPQRCLHCYLTRKKHPTVLVQETQQPARPPWLWGKRLNVSGKSAVNMFESGTRRLQPAELSLTPYQGVTNCFCTPCLSLACLSLISSRRRGLKETTHPPPSTPVAGEGSAPTTSNYSSDVPTGQHSIIHEVRLERHKEKGCLCAEDVKRKRGSGGWNPRGSHSNTGRSMSAMLRAATESSQHTDRRHSPLTY